MDKIKIKNIISTVILFLICCLGFSFYGCQKDEYPFELSEGAQIYTFDSNNLMKLSEIIVEEDRLIYKFDRRNRAGFTPEKIKELTQDKNFKIYLIDNEFGFGNHCSDNEEIIEKGNSFYFVLNYNLDSVDNKALSGFKINQTEEWDSYFVTGFENPYFQYSSYKEEKVFSQEYNNASKTWSEIKKTDIRNNASN